MYQFKKPSQLYMLEFVIFQLFLAVAIGFVGYIFMSSISSIFDEVDVFSLLGIDTSAYLLTGLLVSLPIAVLFAKRTRMREAADPDVKRSKVRRFFMYFFLLAYFVTAAYSAGIILYQLVQNIITIGAGAEWGASFWSPILTQLVPLALAKGAFAYIYNDGQESQVNKLFLPVLLALAVVGVALLIAFPIRENRGGVADAKIEEDLSAIQTEVASYARENGDLPDSLDELGLEGDLADRASDYEYKVNSSTEYELCATFKTDTNSGFSYESPYYHSKGRDCFKDEVYTSSGFDFGDYEDYEFNLDDYNLEDYGL